MPAMAPEEGTALALLKAIKHNNDKDGVALLMHHLSLQSDDAVTVNALFHACTQGNLLAIQQMAYKYLHLFTARNKGGHTLLHVAASNGDSFMVSLLLQIKPELCIMCDDFNEIPLHLAAKNGHQDVVEMLLLAYPDSLEAVNCRLETALHLALKNCETSTALFLLQEIVRQKKQHLLHFEDAEGNTSLHIAVTNELVTIVQWLFSCKTYNYNNHEDMMMMLMNTKNHRKLTLLDIYCREPEDHQKTNSQKQTNLVSQSYEKDNNVRLTVAIGNVGAAFAILTNLPAVFHEEPVKETFSFTDVVSANLPPNFYLLLFVVSMFIAGVIEVGNVIWPHPLRKSLLVTTACTWVVFYLLVESQILRFSIWINGGSISISSSSLLWSSALFLISLMYFAIKCSGFIGWLVAWPSVKKQHIDLEEEEDMSKNSVGEQYV